MNRYRDWKCVIDFASKEYAVEAVLEKIHSHNYSISVEAFCLKATDAERDAINAILNGGTQ